MTNSLFILKNIKFNYNINKFIANEGKKKKSLLNNKKKGTIWVPNRKYSTYNSNNMVKPPNNNWIIAAALICGSIFKLKNNSQK